MEYPNGGIMMKDSMSPTSLSPRAFSPSKGTPESMTSSNFNDASLDELDRIMDTLSTLSRETSAVRNDHRLPMSSQKTSPHGQGPWSRNNDPSSPEQTYSTVTSPSMSMPPPMTSPPRTPVAQSPRHYISHPKVMTLSGLPSANNPAHYYQPTEERSPATIPRLPNNPYENTSILHGSHFIRTSANANNPIPPPSSYTNPVTDSPLTVTTVNGAAPNNTFFFGPLPVSAPDTRHTEEQMPPPPGPKPSTAVPSTPSAYSPSPSRAHYLRSQQQQQPEAIPPRSPTGPANRERSFTRKQRERFNQESLTLPAYNEKRSYLRNLEDCTLPRPRVDSGRNEGSQSLPSNAARILNSKPKGSVTDDTNGTFNRLSLRRHSNKSNRRPNGRLGLQPLSKTPSRHSTSSFNSFDLGRGYTSVSTAPASTHGLIQTEVLPHRRKLPHALTHETPDSSELDKNKGNCCVRSGRFLYSHLLEMFILVAFCAGLPVGIVLQATAFHANPAFEKYFVFFGSTMLPGVLSTITPLLVVSSVLTGVANMTPDVIRRFFTVASLFYVISVVAAACISVTFTLAIKPGTLIASGTPGALYSGQNASVTPEALMWPDSTLLAQHGYLKDDGLSKYGFQPGNYLYATSQAANTSATDEVLRLISLFFPGCGARQDSSMCNLFVLAILSAVLGIGVSTMGVDGCSIRHVIAQIGTVFSRMADILLWYLPIGVLFYISELVATRIDWANIGHDRQTPSGSQGENVTAMLENVYRFNNATQWYFVTVISSLGIYSLFVMPLVVSLLTLTNPLALLGFRSLGPLLTAICTGFSDLCIPITLRCMIKERRHASGCCVPHAMLDRRVARVSAVFGGLFHRGGSAIVVICSTLFVIQLRGQQITFLNVILIAISGMVTSVTSLGGRWFSGVDPYMRSMVIGMTSAGLTSPSFIPKAIFYLWFLSRFGAFVDTIINLLCTHIIFKACKSNLRDVSSGKRDQDEHSTEGSSNVGMKSGHVITSPKKMADPIRSVCGETSDYEDAPLLFNRLIATSIEGGGTTYTVVPYDNTPQTFPVNETPP